MPISSCHWLLYPQKEEGRSPALGSGVSFRTTRLNVSCTVWLDKGHHWRLEKPWNYQKATNQFSNWGGAIVNLPQGHFLSYCLFLLSPLSLQSSWELSLMLNHSLKCLQSYMKRSKLARKWLFSSLYYFIVYIPLAFFKTIFFSLLELFDWKFAFFFHTTQGICMCVFVCVWDPSFPQHEKLFFNQLFLSYDINCLVLWWNFIHIWYAII